MSDFYIIEFDIYPNTYKIGKAQDISKRLEELEKNV